MHSANFDNFVHGREPILVLTTAIIATAVRLVEIHNVKEERILRDILSRSGGSAMAIVEVCVTTLRIVATLFVYRKMCEFLATARRNPAKTCSTRTLSHAIAFLTLGISIEAGFTLISYIAKKYISQKKKYKNIVVEYVASRPFLFTAIAIEFAAYLVLQRIAPLSRMNVMAISTLALLALTFTTVSDIAKDFK